MIQYKVYESKEDWAKFRGGMFTASEISRLLAEPKKKGEVLSEGAKTYIRERVALQFAPAELEHYNSNMQRGNELEPQAVLEIAKTIGLDVNDDRFVYTSENGFVYFFDDLLNLGGTPDVIIRDSHIYEIKCPLSKTHLEYLLFENQQDVKDNVPQYYAQMQVNMYLTSLPYAYFASYDDRYYNQQHHFTLVKVDYDTEFMDKLFVKLEHANEYRKKLIEKLNAN